MRWSRLDLGAGRGRVHPNRIFAVRARRNQQRIGGWSVFSRALLREILQIFISFVQKATVEMRGNVRVFSVGLASIAPLRDALQQPGHLVVLPVGDQDAVPAIKRVSLRERREREDRSPWMSRRRYARL